MPEKKETPQSRWDKENTRSFRLKVMRTTEADILARLEAQPNVSGYIKRLIRRILSGKKSKSEGKLGHRPQLPFYVFSGFRSIKSCSPSCSG